MDDRRWIPKDRSWLAGLEGQLEERRKEIARDDLQPDGYPPFPECPECEAVPEAIRSADPDHPEVFLTGAVVLRFEPCRHVFRVDSPATGEEA